MRIATVIIVLLIASRVAHADTPPPDFLKSCWYPLVPNSPCEKEAKNHPDWARQWAEKQARLEALAKSCPEGSPCWADKVSEWEEARRQMEDLRYRPNPDLDASGKAEARFNELRRELCGSDWERLQQRDLIGLSLKKLELCTGWHFLTTSQMKTMDGILATYRVMGHEANFHVLGGTIVSWEE